MAGLNLAFEILALQNAQFRIVVRTPESEWAVETSAPFTDEELREFTHLHHNPQNPERAAAFGQRLFDFLITSHPQTAQYFNDNCNQPGTRIRLLLEADRAGSLDSLPWELLHTPSIGFLALSPKTPIVRANHDLSLRPPAPVLSPLKALAVIAAPPNYPYLNIDEEWAKLQQVTAPLQAAGLLNLERLKHPTWPALKRRLRAEDFQVLHFVGFSQVDVLTGQVFLALDDDSYASGSRAISGSELGQELGPESTIRLVYLNIREAASGASTRLASELLKSGLASVITSQSSLSAASEQRFIEQLYPPLCEAHPVDAVVNITRRALAEDSSSLDWAAPTLFLRAREGQLFRPIPGVSER